MSAEQRDTPIAKVGDVIAGKLQVTHILGRGGMGVVVAAMHVHLQEKVALKILLPSKSTDRESRTRFLREARVTARLQNEHIAKVMDIGLLDSGSPYFVMEYLEGIDLKRLLEVHGPLDIPVAVNYVAQACEGIAEAHARAILHRDIKPSNLFLTKRYDGSDLIKVLDFGVSKARALGPSEESYHTEAGTVLGSPSYISPERLEENDDVGPPADVWSLAVILYELLTGRPPFWQPTPALICSEILSYKPPPLVREHRPDVPPALEAAIAHALERDVCRRTANVAQLASEMLDALPNDARAAETISIDRIRATLARAGSSEASEGLAGRYPTELEPPGDDEEPSTLQQRPMKRSVATPDHEPTVAPQPSPAGSSSSGNPALVFAAVVAVVLLSTGLAIWYAWR